MLYTRDPQGMLLDWQRGAARFFANFRPPESSYSLPVAVRCRLGSLEEEELALLDTGAGWSMIGGALMASLDGDLGPSVGPVQISTRYGLVRGDLHRLSIYLLADPGCGVDVGIEGTCAVVQDWTGPVVLGFNGFLDRLRIAIDPGTDADDLPMIYFGSGLLM